MISWDLGSRHVVKNWTKIGQNIGQKFGGQNRGAPMVLSGAMNVEIVAFSPDQMKLAELRRIPEERVSAVLGVPAVLAGLGAGLDSATYSNTKELREFFTESKMVPLWSMVAQELTHQLLNTDFQGNDNEYCEYDIFLSPGSGSRLLYFRNLFIL